LACTCAWCDDEAGQNSAAPAAEAATPRERIRDRIQQRRNAPAVGANRGRSETRPLEHAGQKRSYRLHTPPGYEAGTPVPLMIVLHGLLGDGAMMEPFTRFNEVADKEGFVVAYPDGLNRMWRFWESDVRPDSPLKTGEIDDVGFIAAIIDQLVDETTVDARRVYVTGLSNGGYMSNRLACSLCDKIAAIAPVAGTMVPLLNKGAPERPVPVLYFHGTADRIVGYDGVDQITKGKASLSAEQLCEWWAKTNKCLEPLPVEDLPDTVADGTLVKKRIYPAGDGGAPVVFYEISGGGHTWPGGGPQPEHWIGPVCRDIHASELIWQFCSQYSLPEKQP
jgi:polyhydroxybutyrate depolymerase